MLRGSEEKGSVSEDVGQQLEARDDLFLVYTPREIDQRAKKGVTYLHMCCVV
jgi:hypothetical protein